jgi:hypothetical protein
MLIIAIILFGMIAGAAAQLLLGRPAGGIDWSLAFVAGLAGILNQNASLAFVPTVVDRDRLVWKPLVLLPLDELDRMVDRIGGELLELLFRQLDVLERVDDLVVGEESLFLPVLDELVQFLYIWQSDLDGEHEPLLLVG